MASGRLPIDLGTVAQRYVDRWLPQRTTQVGPLARLGSQVPGLDERFCREVADHFDRQPLWHWTADLADRFDLLRQETLRQFEEIAAAGLRVRPWLGSGQPYQGSVQLCQSVRATATLYVFLTRDGFGPADHAPNTAHPMRAPSGIRVGGVELCHNDIYRVVHDVFGHVVHGHSMGPAGEFQATLCHMAMYSDEVHPVLFTEQVSQICWFFFGPHLRTDGGRLPRRGEPGWVEPALRPYPDQKVFPCPPQFVQRFTQIFHDTQRQPERR